MRLHFDRNARGGQTKAMLRCDALTVRAGPDGPVILNSAGAFFARGGLHAVIGPSGCGKTTMMKAMLGLIPASGSSSFDGEALGAGADIAGRVGFAPQFTTAQPRLSVAEALGYQLRLAVADPAERARRLESVLSTTGLAAQRDTRVGSLSGGQLRRLSLALELTLDPPALICDEVTSGLDPDSESAILSLLGGLCHEGGRTVVCIIHNLGALGAFDSVTVVYRGCVVFQGTPEALKGHFGIAEPTRLYARLEERPTEDWMESAPAIGPEGAAAGEKPGPVVESRPEYGRPGALSQLLTLLARRTDLFARDHGYLALTLAITFGFPVMVVIFALKGIPEVPSIPLDRITASAEQAELALRVQIDRAHIASLASGLIMFQVILLTLMGANNGGREIAAERTLYEKERLTGLRPGAYAMSKLVFTGALAIFQGLWMAAFVKVLCAIPGPWGLQCGVMAACALAMTWVCLGLSALLASAEKASLLSIYLVGFQLPLSGVVLALPPALDWVCRPFVNAYWSWSGAMRSLDGNRLYDAYRETASPDLVIAVPAAALAALAVHAAVGSGMTFAGCRQRRPL